MMGTRGKTSGSERDAFSRLSRRLLGWSRGEPKKIKRSWWRRVRAKVKQALLMDGGER